MRIHSDFRDYYDIGLSVGVDPLLHYNRKIKGVHISDVERLFLAGLLSEVRMYRNHPDGPNVERILIGFCGVIYPCFRVMPVTGDVECIYEVARLNQVIKPRPEYKGFRRYRRFRSQTEAQQREAFLASRKRADALFIELQAPIFVVEEDPDDLRHNQMVLNVSLREYQFAKVKDPFTAFQELSMYLGNELVKHDQPDEIADEYRIAMHGYDKRSFRHPTRVAHLSR